MNVMIVDMNGVKVMVKESNDTLEEFMNNIISNSKDGHICVFSNLEAKLPLSNDDFAFFESITKVIPSLEKKIQNIFLSLSQDYTIQHFRFSFLYLVGCSS